VEGKARGPCPQSLEGWRAPFIAPFVTRISIDGLLEQGRGLRDQVLLASYNPKP